MNTPDQLAQLMDAAGVSYMRPMSSFALPGNFIFAPTRLTWGEQAFDQHHATNYLALFNATAMTHFAPNFTRVAKRYPAPMRIRDLMAKRASA